MIRKKPNHEPRKALESLLGQAKHYASHMMSTAGSVPLTMMALTPEGFLMFVPQSLGDSNSKDKFAKAGRLVAVGYKAKAVAMILESWATFATRPGQKLPLTPPSQSPNREEVVAIMAEARGVQSQQFLFIQRNSFGKFIGFGTSLLPQYDSIEGRFAQMMPLKEPGEKESKAARDLLNVLGIKVSGSNEHTWN